MAGDFITIGVAAKGPVRKYIEQEEALVPKGATSADLITALGIPDGLRSICLKDGKRLSPAAKLHDGDSVIIISILSGG